MVLASRPPGSRARSSELNVVIVGTDLVSSTRPPEVTTGPADAAGMTARPAITAATHARMLEPLIPCPFPRAALRRNEPITAGRRRELALGSEPETHDS